MENVRREVTPLREMDCFMVFSRKKPKFNFHMHYHPEFELNYVNNAAGAKRIVGDSVEETGGEDLVLIGPNLNHVWTNHKCDSNDIHEVTIQFHADLFDEKLLARNQLKSIKSLFEKSSKGVSFPLSIIASVRSKILNIASKNGFDSVLELLSLLYDLSLARDMKVLSSTSFSKKTHSTNEKLEKVFNYMQKNYDESITLGTISKLANMTEVGFSRFIKNQTGKTFVENLNDIRMGHATRLLIDSDMFIAEICYKCGFNNISNFNRMFKRKKDCTPKEFRENFAGLQTII